MCARRISEILLDDIVLELDENENEEVRAEIRNWPRGQVRQAGPNFHAHRSRLFDLRRTSELPLIPQSYNFVSNLGTNGGVILEPDSSSETNVSDESEENGESPDVNPSATVRNTFGNYKSICRGYKVVGPGWKFFVVSAFLLVVTVSILAFTHEALVIEFGRWIPYSGYMLWMLLFYFFLQAGTTDPGIMPRNVSRRLHNTLYRQNSLKEFGYNKVSCARCGAIRPPRTYHCSKCDICIRGQDVHVPYLGICIGERNRAYFYFLNASVVGFSVFLIVFNSILFKRLKSRENVATQDPKLLHSILAIVSIVIGVVMILLPNFGLVIFLYRFYLIAFDRTIREEFHMLYQGYPAGALRPLGLRAYCTGFKEFLSPTPKTKSYITRRNNVGPAERGRISLEPSRHFWKESHCRREQLLPSINYRRLRQLTMRHISNPHPQNNTWLGLKFDEENGLLEDDDSLQNANAAKRRSHHSTPLLHDGELRSLPTARHQYHLHQKPFDRISSNITQYQQMLDLPKATADLQFQQKLKQTGTLSLDDLPQSPWNQNVENELLFAARARQMLHVVNLVRSRDRDGLVELSRRINIGSLMGTGHLDPENLQIVELEHGLPFLVVISRRGIGFRHEIAQRGLTGITQMVAAGLMSRDEGIQIREVFYTPPALAQQAIAHSRLMRITRPAIWGPQPFHSRRYQINLPAAVASYLPVPLLNMGIGQAQRRRRSLFQSFPLDDLQITANASTSTGPSQGQETQPRRIISESRRDYFNNEQDEQDLPSPDINEEEQEELNNNQ